MDAQKLLEFLEVNWEIYAAFSLLATFITNYLKRHIPAIVGKYCVLASLGVAALLAGAYCAKADAWDVFLGLAALIWFSSMVAWDTVKAIAHKVGPKNEVTS